MCIIYITFFIGLAGLERPEQPTVSAASMFFVSYVGLVESAEPIRNIMSQKGASLVQFILQAIAGAAPRSYLNSFSDVLSALNNHCIGLLSQWLEVRKCGTMTLEWQCVVIVE